MILFSDFDGTLYFKDDMYKTHDNIKAIESWKKRGNKFCITTGRSLKSVTFEMPQIKELCDYYIVDSGSIILSKTGEFLHGFYFEPKTVSDIIDFSGNFPESPIPFYYTVDSENAEYKTEGVTKLRLWFTDLGLLEGVANKLCETFPVFTVFQDAKSIYKELEKKKGFVEIIPLESGKCNAIGFLQGKEKIPNTEIITVGDGFNDFSMVKNYNGFAIKSSVLSNAHPELNTTATVAELIL